MAVYQGATPTGFDHGIVWFDEGRLYFTGRRTSFGLVAGQTQGVLKQASSVRDLRSSLTIGLSSGVSVGFDAMDLTGPVEIAREKLAWGIRRWMLQNESGEGQGPPLEIGPGVPLERTLFLCALTSSLPWFMVSLGAFLVFFDSSLYGTLACPILFLLIFFYETWHPRVRWRAWRDRRALTRRR